MTAKLPAALEAALAPITILAGHYGAGKTNLSINLAIDCAAMGKRVTLVDLDIVNPYFRATEQRRILEDHGVSLIAPVFSEAGTSLDVPSLTGAIEPAFRDVADDSLVIVDLGGDDVGAAALGRFSKTVASRDYALLYVLNRHRNLMQDPADAIENLREIEAVTHLHATALVDNAHMKQLTDDESLADRLGYAQSVGAATDLPLAAKTVPVELCKPNIKIFNDTIDSTLVYPISLYIKNPWE
jgi:hypothetical protein